MGKLSELKVSEVPMGVDVIDNQEEEAQQPISTGRSRHREQDASGVLSEFNERAFDFIPLKLTFQMIHSLVLHVAVEMETVFLTGMLTSV